MIDVLTVIAFYLEKSMIYVLIFAVQKFVLLEKSFEKKKQTRYYIITYIISMLVATFSADVADVLMLFFCGLNSFLTRTRKEKRMLGFLMTIPNMGLINGTIGPLFNVPLWFISEDTVWKIGDSIKITGEDIAIIYQCTMYLIIVGAFIVFYVKGKAWREKFDTDMKKSISTSATSAEKVATSIEIIYVII